MTDWTPYLREYLRADHVRAKQKYPLLARLTFGEHARVRTYLNVLRHVEYYKNKKRSLPGAVLYACYLMRYRYLSLTTNMYVLPNTTGAGLLLPHPGFVRVGSMCRIGKNCTILPNVLFGKKSPDVEDATIIVGDNCYFDTGATVLGPVRIGNNVTVGAGAVVTKDVDDDETVVGILARPVRKKSLTNVGGVNLLIITYLHVTFGRLRHEEDMVIWLPQEAIRGDAQSVLLVQTA